MYIDVVPNRDSTPAILLRESVQLVVTTLTPLQQRALDLVGARLFGGFALERTCDGGDGGASA